MAEAAGGVLQERWGGVLLHPTSLPGGHGIGDLGPAAWKWLDWLAAAGCRLWQVLPLGPTGYGDSPYQGLSAFAGNPLFISLDLLVEERLLTAEEVAALPALPEGCVDYGQVQRVKLPVLRLAARRFLEGRPPHLEEPYGEFGDRAAGWLEDFALFMALKEAHGGRAWLEWPQDLRRRAPEALAEARRALAGEVAVHRALQFLFFLQWSRLKDRARERGITLIGDVPIFVAHDSADVWAHPEWFHLDADGRPTVVAGVPPDYFSEDGQRWGNPLYRWEALATEGYRWWVERLRWTMEMVDVVRLDHFRGFQAYWEVPASAPSAREGRWAPGPGAPFLVALREALGGLPFIAEDLGVITPEVTALREAFGLPGMKVLQFAFDGEADNPYLPHNYEPGYVVYTGTHDNDTARGWFDRAPEPTRAFCLRYLASDGREIAWDLVRAAWSSVARWAVAPMQDLLGLGSEARMNVPSRLQGNWRWRLLPDQADEDLAARLAEVNHLYGRTANGR